MQGAFEDKRFVVDLVRIILILRLLSLNNNIASSQVKVGPSLDIVSALNFSMIIKLLILIFFPLFNATCIASEEINANTTRRLSKLSLHHL